MGSRVQATVLSSIYGYFSISGLGRLTACFGTSPDSTVCGTVCALVGPTRAPASPGKLANRERASSRSERRFSPMSWGTSPTLAGLRSAWRAAGRPAKVPGERHGTLRAPCPGFSFSGLAVVGPGQLFEDRLPDDEADGRHVERVDPIHVHLSDRHDLLVEEMTDAQTRQGMQRRIGLRIPRAASTTCTPNDSALAQNGAHVRRSRPARARPRPGDEWGLPRQPHDGDARRGARVRSGNGGVTGVSSREPRRYPTVAANRGESSSRAIAVTSSSSSQRGYS